MPVYADVVGVAVLLNQTIWNGGITDTITDVKGSTLGLKQTTPGFGCWEKVYDPGGAWVNHSISCPI
jgi:hypothetical protein